MNRVEENIRKTARRPMYWMMLQLSGSLMDWADMDMEKTLPKLPALWENSVKK